MDEARRVRERERTNQLNSTNESAMCGFKAGNREFTARGES